VKFVNGGGNKPPFLEHIDYIDRQITLAATCGLLTMLAEAGSGTLAGNAHADTFLQIARSDAALLSGLFQEQFDTPLLREYFPDQPILAYFEFAPPAADEVSRVVKDAVELAKAGVLMDLRELEEKTGYKLERNDSGMVNSLM
jgi:phage gp29-like protein